jgi:hypothetical protein
MHGETQMRFPFRFAGAAFVLIAAVSLASAQSTMSDTRLQLSQEQKQQIYKSLTVTLNMAQPTASRADIEMRIGASLPQSVRLLDIPSAAVAEVPAVGRYKYVMVGTDVAIVEPSSRQIVEVLSQ